MTQSGKKPNDSLVKRFAQQTTCHGFAHLERAPKLFKVIIAIAMLTSLGFMTYQLESAFSEFFEYGVVTAVTIERDEESDQFPNVTICNLNPYRSRSTEDTISEEVQKTLDFSEGELTWATALAQYLGRSYSTEHINKLLFYSKVAKEYEADASNVEGFTNPIKDTLLECRIEQYKCLPDNFTEWYNPTFGKCFTFFTQNAKFITTFGPDGGLQMQLNTVVDKYLKGISRGVGFIVLLHGEEFPVPEELGFMAQVGTTTSVGVSKTDIFRLSSPYSNCGAQKDNVMYTNYHADLNMKFKYSEKVCNMQGRLEAIAEACNCLDYRIAPQTVLKQTLLEIGINATNMTACDGGDQIRCMFLVNTATCEFPCQETIYKPELSFAKFPNAGVVEKKWNVWSSRDLGIKGMIVRELNGTDDYDAMSETLETMLAEIHIYRKDQTRMTIVDYAAMDVWDLTSSIGGLLGLYMGISFLTVLEFGELLARMMMCKK